MQFPVIINQNPVSGHYRASIWGEHLSIGLGALTGEPSLTPDGALRNLADKWREAQNRAQAILDLDQDDD